MPSTTVIILDEYPPPTPELLDALRLMDAELVPRTLGELLRGPLEVLPVADVLLAPAEADGESIRSAVRRLRRWAGAPIVVVWTVTEFAALQHHVRLGHDYLVPPFLPALVGARLHSCSERAGLGRTLREADARAELMGYEKELEIGREIQAGFLPESLPVPTGWRSTYASGPHGRSPGTSTTSSRCPGAVGSRWSSPTSATRASERPCSWPSSARCCGTPPRTAACST
ncbi:hypothetical protein ACFSNO_17060 [Streptomyces cirratus]